MSDGRVIIDSKIDGTGAEQGLQQIQTKLNEVKQKFQEAEKALLPFKTQLLQTEVKMLELAQSMDTFQGTNAQFMDQVKQLGAEYKKASDAMIANNNLAKASMIQTAGQMMNMSTQAQKISENYDRMGNPIYKVNQAGLAVANTLNKIALNGNASVLALRLLGPTANMKQLRDMQGMINQGLVRFQMVALGALVTGVLVYGGLHKAAMKSNEGYKKSFETMVANLKKAFQPMVDVFAMVMTKVYDFINAIAVMAIKFNEAHPTLAKIIQGIMMLIPALLLILSPLAIGIGLWAGLQAAWGFIWTMIGPLITGLAAMSATVWIVAAAIVGLVAGIMYLWKTNEGFRNAIITGWQVIKAAAIATWNFILNNVLLPVWNAIVSFGKQLFGKLKEFWDQNGKQIKQIAQTIWAFVVSYVITHIQRMVTTAKFIFEVLKSVVQAVWGNIKGIIQAAIGIILGIIGLFANLLTGNWRGAWENVKSILQNAWDLMKNVATMGVNAFLGVVRGLGNALGGVFSNIGNSFYNAGRGFIDMMIQGIEGMIGKVTSTISKVAGKIRNFLPFSPAKVGPLSDLDKLDFGGPISDSITKGLPLVQGLLGDMLALPAISPTGPQTSTIQKNSTRNIFEIGQLVVREEADIDRIAQRLHVLQQRSQRTGGRG
ncbi:phage tail protein [Ectobacillus antri]|uniref:phage tail protein n=1 Tax=Ectobacillus antri TaxID=2486280 RepID=UPI000F5B6E37|nr:hypothetical protein [Ectobacillus antri]